MTVLVVGSIALDTIETPFGKAEDELGYRSRPYIEGLKDAVCWFREAGYLRRC